MTYSLSALTMTSVTVSSLASAHAFAASHNGCGTRTDLAGVFGWFGMSAPCGGEHPVDRVDFGVGCTRFGETFDGFVLVAGAVADGDGLAVGDLCAVGAGHGVHVCPFGFLWRSVVGAGGAAVGAVAHRAVVVLLFDVASVADGECVDGGGGHRGPCRSVYLHLTTVYGHPSRVTAHNTRRQQNTPNSSPVITPLSATLPTNRIERTRHRGDGNRVLHQHLTTAGVAL